MSQLFSTVRVARSITARWPEGLAKLSEVLIPANARPPTITTDVGSPPTITEPSGLGAAGSAMSMKPTAPSRLLE